MSEDILVGSVAVDIVPDTRKFRAELDAKVQGITIDVGVTADTSSVRAKLSRLERPREATVTAVADISGAEAKLDEVSRTRTAKVRTNVDTLGLSDVQNKLAGISGLTTALVGLGPALIPIAAVLGGIAITLGAPLAIAAGGATVFGFLAGFAVKKTEEQKKKIDQLATAVDSAKQSLANAQSSSGRSAANSLAIANASATASLQSAHQALANAKTAAQRHAAQARIDAANDSLQARRAAIARSQSATVANAQDRVTQAVGAYQAALAGLTPAQKRFLDAQDKLKGAFQTLLETSGPQILGPVTKGLQVLAGLMPALSPLIGAVSGALTELLDGIGSAAKGQGFKDFIDAFSKQVTPDIITFGHIAGNILSGVSGLVLTLGGQFSHKLLKGLEDLSGRFSDFGQNAGKSKALQDFFAYIHRVGPQVGDTVGAVARAIGHIVAALAPLGPPALKIIEGIADKISGIPIPVLTALATAFVAMAAAAKVGKGLSALGLLSGGGGLGKGGGVLGQFVSAAKPVPVFVTNPGFGVTGGGGKGPGGVPVVDPRVKGAPSGAVAEAEAEARAAAKAAAETVKAAGGDVASQSQAAARAFKGALAERDAAVIKEVLEGGKIVGGRTLLRAILGAPAGVTLGAAGNENLTHEHGIDLVNGVQSEAAFLKLTQGKTLEATTTHVDALRASLGKASRNIDLIGPHSDVAFGQASKDVKNFTDRLDAIHDKKVRILLDDLDAVRSLEALQRFRLRDKTLTVNEVERGVGPGGGIGHPAASASPKADNSKLVAGGSGGSSAGGPLVNINHAEIMDTNDVLRKSQDAVTARAGGGVILRPSRTARF